MPAPKKRAGPFHQLGRALRHRNYRLFFGGQLVSLIGTWMQSVAQQWLVYRLTGSSVLLGFVAFWGQIPVFLIAPVGGALADRFPRRRLLIGTQAASMLLAFVLAALTMTGTVRASHVFVLAALLGVVNGIDIPTRQAFVVQMVGREDLMNAIALNSSMVNGARIVGPAVAGLVVAAVGEGWCFLLNGLSFLAVIAGLFLMRDIRLLPPRVRGSAVHEIVEGFRFVLEARAIASLLALLGLVSLMGMPYAVLMPIFADRVLGGGARTLGVLMTCSGLGALLGALLLATREKIAGLGRWVTTAAAGFGVSLLAFSTSHSYVLSCVLLVPVGFSMMVQMAASNTLIQAMSPDALRGRVMAVYSMMFMGMAPIGALFAGGLAGRLGPAGTVALGGGCCILGAAVFGWQLPKVRASARKLIVAIEASGGDPSAAETTGSRPLPELTTMHDD